MSTFAGTEYDQKSKKLISIIQALRDCGTEEVIKLPKIAVIGNQSVGKSSLIEAISQVRLPRASGTCTRCPMEVILRRGDSDNRTWSCKVSLRFEHEEVARQELCVLEFARTTDRDEVSIILRRAQLAILNPSENHTLFQSLAEEECKDYPTDIPFSRNSVVLEITGAEVDVTFLDLPGIIASTEKDNQAHLIELIRNLAISYISQRECLILVTISMKDDIDNQSALQLARKYDPEGLRTIGVLTKPDTVDLQDTEVWEKIMKGNSHRLRLGYYMTRLPKSDPKESNMSPNEVKTMEYNYFHGHHLWGKMNKEHLGSGKLAEALSNRLSKMIQEILPNLKANLSSKRREIADELQKLPPSLAENPQAELLSLCTRFIKLVNEYVRAKGDSPGDSSISFIQEVKQHYRALKDSVLRTRPKFQVVLQKDQNFKVCNEEGEIPIEEVRSMISDMTTRELEGITPFPVHENLITRFVKSWEPLCLNVFENVETLLENKVREFCSQVFDRFRSSGLLLNINAVSSGLLQTAGEKTRRDIKSYCWTESNRPFTQCSEYKTWREEHRTAIAVLRHGGSPLDLSASHLKGSSSFSLQDANGQNRTYSTSFENLSTILTAYGVQIDSLKQLARLHVDDYDSELTVIAHVLSYFDVSSKRIIDDIPMVFETSFALTFARELETNLNLKLGLVGEGGLETCGRYAADEPEIQKRREDLGRQLEILKRAEETVIKFHLVN